MALRANLREAVAAKFGKDSLPPDAVLPTEAEIDAAKETINGNAAQVDVANTELAKVKGDWKIALFDSMPKDVAEKGLPGLDRHNAGMRQATADVTQGRVKTVEDAHRLLLKYPLPFTAVAVPVGGGVEQGSGRGQR